VRSNTPTVWVLEGHPLAAQYLLRVLRRRGVLRIVSLDEARQHRVAMKKSPSVLVVDREALSSGVPASLQSLRTAFPDAKILIMGRPIGDEEILDLVLGGVRGFINYDNATDELSRAIDVVAAGHLWIKREVLDKLPNHRSKVLDPRNNKAPTLTSRERAILDMLQQRLSNKEIASKLAITERTVKFHLKNLFIKLGVHDRYSAVDLVRSNRTPQDS
jgi:DNA-binding NarL/FixJ family response regulator